MDVKAPQADDKAPAKLKVKVTDLTSVNRVMPVYPPEAKADHVTGEVLLAATIGKDGTVEHLKVTQSVRADVDASAMDAVVNGPISPTSSMATRLKWRPPSPSSIHWAINPHACQRGQGSVPHRAGSPLGTPFRWRKDGWPRTSTGCANGVRPTACGPSLASHGT
jgi:TonB family protein